MVYSALNLEVAAAVPHSARVVLDLGCGDGALGAFLKARQTCVVHGVTHSQQEADRAHSVLDRVERADLDSSDWSAPGAGYDAIICSHVLEHLRDPPTVLGKLKRLAAPECTLVVALPNAVHWRQRLAFAQGRFRYTDGGILDRTHLRFYDWTTARALVEGGWLLIEAKATGHFPLLWRLPGLGVGLDRLACRLAPNLIGEQFVLLASQSAS